jgi:hypothetical protein
MCQFGYSKNQPDFIRDGNNINNIWSFNFATIIAELEGFCSKTYTPICSVEKKRGGIMMTLPLSLDLSREKGSG